MMSSIIQTNEAVTEQEVELEQGQDGAPWSPGQTKCLINMDAARTQHLQGNAAAFPAAV